MPGRRLILSTAGVLSLIGLATASVAQAFPDEDGGRLSRQLRGAERILIGTPEKDVDAPGGEQFLVEINEVLRGGGRRGELARIANSGDKNNYPRFKGGQRYVFVLKKNQSGR